METNVLDKLKNLREDAKISNVPILRQKTSELLGEMVEKLQPENILEIGTAIGYSGILMLSKSQNSFLTTIEKDEEVAQIAQKNFEEVGYSDRKKILIGDCIEFLPKLSEKERYDFIFLDGPKGQYIKYLPYLLKMLNVNGYLFSDNVLYRGMVNGKIEVAKSKKTLVKNLRLFLEELDKNIDVEHKVLDIEDGISICKKIS